MILLSILLFIILFNSCTFIELQNINVRNEELGKSLVPKENVKLYLNFDKNYKDYNNFKNIVNIKGEVYFTNDRFDNPEKALYFTGKNSFLVIDNLRNIEMDEFTISLFFNPDTTNVANLIAKPYVSGGKPDDNSFVFNYYRGGVPSFHTSTTNKDGDAWVDYKKIEPGKWYHFAITKKGRKINFYFDGKLVTNSYTTIEKVNYDNSPLIIGADDVGADGIPDYLFQGAIDDVLILDIALDDNKINEIYLQKDKLF